MLKTRMKLLIEEAYRCRGAIYIHTCACHVVPTLPESPQCSWWGLVLAKTRPAHQVTRKVTSRPRSCLGSCGSLIVSCTCMYTGTHVHCTCTLWNVCLYMYMYIVCCVLNACTIMYLNVNVSQECLGLTVSSQGQVTDRLSLHPSVDNTGYIVKVSSCSITKNNYRGLLSNSLITGTLVDRLTHSWPL